MPESRDGPAAAQNLRRALLTRSTGQRRRPMKRRDISITTGAAVLAMQARFDTEMAGGHQPDPRPDRRANQQA